MGSMERKMGKSKQCNKLTPVRTPLLHVNFLLIFSSFTFQMLSPKPPIPSSSPAPQPTHSCFLALAFSCTGAYDLRKTKGLSSHWWPTRLSSATYATRDTALGVLVSSYCCSSYRVADSFSSLGTFSSSSIGGGVSYVPLNRWLLYKIY